jgi:hypothetical protein
MEFEIDFICVLLTKVIATGLLPPTRSECDVGEPVTEPTIVSFGTRSGSAGTKSYIPSIKVVAAIAISSINTKIYSIK